MNGPELAAMLSDVLGRTVTCDVRHPADMEAKIKAGGLKVENWYARSSVELCTQLADGRLGYFGTVRDDIPYLLGRPGTSFRDWATAHRKERIDLVDQRVEENLQSKRAMTEATGVGEPSAAC